MNAPGAVIVLLRTVSSFRSCSTWMNLASPVKMPVLMFSMMFCSISTRLSSSPTGYGLLPSRPVRLKPAPELRMMLLRIVMSREAHQVQPPPWFALLRTNA